MHCGGDKTNADNCVSKEPNWMVKPLSAGYVNTVVAC